MLLVRRSASHRSQLPSSYVVHPKLTVSFELVEVVKNGHSYENGGKGHHEHSHALCGADKDSDDAVDCMLRAVTGNYVPDG